MTENKDFLGGGFCAGGIPLDGAPRWGMSLRAAGSMRFRWDERNERRDAFLAALAEGRQVAAVELVHSRTVFAVDSARELAGCRGDGIITRNRALLPVVTVADCMPLFLYEPDARVFGVLHSGWKGTGIVRSAIELAEQKYGADRRRFCVVMGPHIHSCCYTIDEERASYFRAEFTPDCVRGAAGSGYALSLARANLAVLDAMGVPADRIQVSSCCTCCDSRFGSFRRETAGLPAAMPLPERQRRFTVQAAWVKW
ncbi:MAG TPA: laccase [Treponema sp.]|nr:laccase [Treponema sp.]